LESANQPEVGAAPPAMAPREEVSGVYLQKGSADMMNPYPHSPLGNIRTRACDVH